MTSEPIRLFDDPAAAAALRADLVYAAEGTVEGLNIAAGVAGLTAAIAAEAAAGGAAAGATATAANVGGTATAGGGVMKVVLALGLVAGGATAWWTSGPTPEPDQAVAALAPSPETSAAKAPASIEPATVEPAPAEPIAEPIAQPVAIPEPEVSVAVAAEPPVDVEPAAPATKRHPRAHKRAPSAEVGSSKADDHLKEARLIAQARRSLRSKPAQSLKLLKEAQRDFPKGMLQEEAEALSILALVELGRDTAASPRAKAFLGKHSDGPYADAVRRAIATPPNE